MSSYEALLLYPCKQVHTFFMKFSILTIYLSKDWEVLWVDILSPWKSGPHIKKAFYVLETTDFELMKKIKVGVVLQLEDTETSTKVE